MDSIRHFMRFRKVPQQLQHRICSYYNYLSVSGQSVRDKKLFDLLPETLALQLDLSLKRKLIENSTLFENCAPIAVVAVIRRLEQTISIPVTN